MNPSILTPHVGTLLTRRSEACLVFPPRVSMVAYSHIGFVIQGILNFTPLVCLEDFFLVNTQQHCRYLSNSSELTGAYKQVL